MFFLRWVRAGVLTSSVLLSAGVLALSAILIYTRSTESLFYFDPDSSNGGGYSHQQFALRALAGFARQQSSGTVQPDVSQFSNGGGNNPSPIVILPSGHELDTVLTTSVAIINILTAPLLLLADLLKRKTWLATLVVEASWLFVLWALWLTCGAYTAWCSQSSFINLVRCQDSPSQCLQYKFLEALSFINWITLMLYANTLFTIAVINHMRRHPIWLARVRDAPRLPPLVLAAAPHPALALDEVKSLAHSTSLLSASTASLPRPRSRSDAHAPLLPSIGEAPPPSPLSVAPPSPLSAAPLFAAPAPAPAHAVAHPARELVMPPTYTERAHT